MFSFLSMRTLHACQWPWNVHVSERHCQQDWQLFIYCLWLLSSARGADCGFVCIIQWLCRRRNQCPVVQLSNTEADTSGTQPAGRHTQFGITFFRLQSTSDYKPASSWHRQFEMFPKVFFLFVSVVIVSFFFFKFRSKLNKTCIFKGFMNLKKKMQYRRYKSPSSQVYSYSHSWIFELHCVKWGISRVWHCTEGYFTFFAE